MAERYFNNFSTTVAVGGYTAGSGVLNVGSTAGISLNSGDTCRLSVYDGSGNLVVILIASVVNSGTQFAVTAEGSDANALATYQVLNTLTVGGMNQIRSDINSVGPMASIPSSFQQKGQRYIATDSVFGEFIFDGSLWIPYTAGLQMSPPLSGSFGTTVVGANGTIDSFANSADGALLFKAHRTSGSGDNLCAKMMAVPATPYTFRVRFYENTDLVASWIYGICLYDSGSGKFVTFGLCGTSISCWREVAWNSSTSASGVPFQSGQIGGTFRGGLADIQLTDDGSNRNWLVCADGHNQVAEYVEGNTTFLTPTHIGLVIVPYANSAGPCMTICSLEIGA